ncbi:serine/threonine protein kinase, partial [Myxococcota bacterium]|nr:serine/threonine protein kinase [Myxococcota bacterium]
MRGPELERYQIVGELGQGGMSVVYRARDRQLARDVAVKVLHDFLARQPDARKRFHREAVAVAKLHHPGIVEIFDYSGPEAKDSYIVTELIEGETLRERVDKRGRPAHPELAMLLVLELVRALKHAHEQSVLHRDLKPENVMITKSGSLKLMDFGLAQLMDGGTKLTQTGTLLGSPAHMAPEVIDGKSSDARADIFSMGTILYWLSTGRLPFEAPNPSALFKKILDGVYEHPQAIEPRVGNGLARIIERALEPDPERRYQDVTELEADLTAELADVDLVPTEAHVRRYLVDPDGFARELAPKLVETLARAGKKALDDKNLARATDRFNRVLAIEPEHPEVRVLVARLGRRRE